MSVQYTDIAGMIDHSMLKPFTTDSEVIAGCELANEYHVASVCVRPSDLPLAKEVLKNSEVLVTTVIGFPHGTDTTEAKLAEADDAINKGAVELDVVINIGKLKSGNENYVAIELQAIIDLAHSRDVKVKVIFENYYLTNEEKIVLCEICNRIRPDWVKTSTGFGTGGATIEDLKLMRKHCNAAIQIKASGGIRDLETILKMREIGCTRIGLSGTKAILDELKKGKH